jgi:hypothetical protein
MKFFILEPILITFSQLLMNHKPIPTSEEIGRNAKLDAEYVVKRGTIQVPFNRYTDAFSKSIYERLFHMWCKHFYADCEQ